MERFKKISKFLRYSLKRLHPLKSEEIITAEKSFAFSPFEKVKWNCKFCPQSYHQSWTIFKTVSHPSKCTYTNGICFSN